MSALFTGLKEVRFDGSHVGTTTSASAYSLLDAYMSDDEEFEDNQTPESMRKLQARSRDPVHCVKLVEAVATSLNVCQSLNGGQERFFRERLGGVDPLLLEELQRRLQGQLKG